MEPLIPPKQVFFGRPRRISRLYPIFSLILLLLGSGIIYTWQLNVINADTAVQDRDRKILDLESKLSNLSNTVTVLSAKSQQDQADLDAKQLEIKTSQEKLTQIEQQLKDKATELANNTAALQAAQTQLATQQSQLSTNASELEKLRQRPPLFSFQNSSTRASVTQDEADVKAVVNAAYDTIREIYGSPYLLNQIKISFVDEFSIKGSSGEIVITNGNQGVSIEIKLKAFSKSDFQDVNTLIHEIIHGFHGVAVLDSSVLEEGITVAATDAVMERMIQDGNLPHFDNLYIGLTDQQYQLWNSDLSFKKDNDAFYQYSEVAKVYQVVGKAWLNLYDQDNNFFKNFNNAYYPLVQKGQKPTDSLVRQTISGLITKVNGQTISSYLSSNKAFNPE